MKTLLIASSCLIMLIGTAGVKALPTTANSDGKLIVETNQSSVSSVNSSFSHSTNTIQLDRNLLEQTHLLTLEASSALTGTIILDGEVIQEIATTNTTIDLASKLSPGEHQLIIEVKSPQNEVIKMVFKSPNNSIQHSSNQALHHTLNLRVR